MKRVFSVLLILTVLLTFSSCSKPHDIPVNTAVTSTATTHGNESYAPTEDIAVPLQVPMITVSMPTVEEIEHAKDGTEIFRYIYQNMSMILPDPENAEKIIVDFLNRIDSTTGDAVTIKQRAIADYMPGNWTPYLCQIVYAPTRLDTGILSLFGNYTTYSGSVHPDSADISVNYDLVTGKTIQLDTIFTAEPTEILVSEVIQALTIQKEDKYLFDDFEVTVKERFNNGLSHENRWYFSNTGLCFYFSAYDIAPYASGTVIAEIPYKKLVGFLDDAYFPVETDVVKGALHAELFNEKTLDHYGAYSEIIIDQGATKALLHTDSAIYDVRIETGSWSSDGDTFIADYTVYAAYALTAGNAIMVESEIPDTLPRLRITYTTGGKTLSCYLTDSGNDGSIILIQG